MRDDVDDVRVRVTARRRSSARLADLAPQPSRADRDPGGVLDRAHLRHGVRLGARRAEDGHAAQVADVAVALAAGVQRRTSTRPPPGRTARGSCSLPIAVGSSRTPRRAAPPARAGVSASSCFVVPGPAPSTVAAIAATIASAASRSTASSSGRLTARSISGSAGLDEPQAGQRRLQCRDEASAARRSPRWRPSVRQPRPRSWSATHASPPPTARCPAASEPGRRGLVLRAVDGSAHARTRRRARRAGGRPRAGSGRRGSRRSSMEVAVGAEQVADVVARGRHDDVDRPSSSSASSLARSNGGSPAPVMGRMLSRAFDVALVTRLRSLREGAWRQWEEREP